MISDIKVSDRSIELLHRRQLDDTQIGQFTQLLNQTQQSQLSAKEKLQNQSTDQLALLQKAHSLAEPINISSLSEEGAANLLVQPDHSKSVDLNNDGIVEVGIARTIVYPPVNAPQFVKQAWAEATKDMPEMDKAMLQLRMYTFNGIKLDGSGLAATPPETNWDSKYINDLFTNLRSNLEFEVNMEGWTEFNKNLKDFYDKFEQALGAKSTAATSQPHQSTQSDSKKIRDMLTLLLDARMGVDREKINEIEAKMKAIENDNSLSDEQKQQLLQQLEKEKQQLLTKAQERMVENEKLKTPSLQLDLAQTLTEKRHRQLMGAESDESPHKEFKNQ